MPARSGEWLEKIRPADGDAALPRRALGRRGRDARGRGGARRSARRGQTRTAVERGDIVREVALRAARAARGAVGESSQRRRGSREASPAARPTPPSRWGCSSPARAGALRSHDDGEHAAPHRDDACASRSASPGCIMSFNTPLPNVAWKAFPAIFCGNAAVVKPSEEAPALGVRCSPSSRTRPACRLACSTSSRGSEPRPARRSSSTRTSTSSASPARPRRAGGSTRPQGAGSRRSASSSAARTRSSSATTPTSTAPSRWALASAFSNAGQRCAAASRIVVFDAVYEDFRERLLVEAAAALEPEPVISEASLERILGAVDARGSRARRSSPAAHGSTGRGWYLAPTVVEGAAPRAEISAPSCSAR